MWKIGLLGVLGLLGVVSLLGVIGHLSIIDLLGVIGSFGVVCLQVFRELDSVVCRCGAWATSGVCGLDVVAFVVSRVGDFPAFSDW